MPCSGGIERESGNCQFWEEALKTQDLPASSTTSPEVKPFTISAKSLRTAQTFTRSGQNTSFRVSFRINGLGKPDFAKATSGL